MAEKKSYLRVVNGDISDLKSLTPTWDVPDVKRGKECPKCGKFRKWGSFFVTPQGKRRLNGAIPSRTCGSCRNRRKRARTKSS